ncbi:MAG: glycoside hydrolase 100 family protein [Candidatus Woesearchaeota archaeon]
MVKKNILDEAYEKAKEVMKICSTKYGLYASGGKKGYKGVWSRDSMISLIGAGTDKDKLYKEQFKKSLITLAKYQSKLGQIPNAVLKLDKKKRQADFKSIDSSLWFVIGHYIYKKRYRDSNLFKKQKKNIDKAILWIKQRDIGEDVTLEQLSTTDWQDAFPNKYGAVIGTQALYYKILDDIKENKVKNKLKKIVNESKENQLWSGKYYWAYRWKNHNKYKEIGDWFDSFGNLIAIIFDLADRKKSISILKYIEKNKVARPYPMKDIHPTIKPDGKYWEDYYYDAKATPNNYLNGGIWPFIGSFYVLALIKLKKYKEAKKELEKLADANLRSNSFPEWINPISRETHGVLQAWSAGTYMWAYNSLKKKRVIL